ncbi:MAG: hypothetical protein EKK53_17770 [Burkholderiales bacterium]|nr:MAG: hypothetical protein EKK53_17770 [Burkholderiales bacterium]
MDRVRSFRGLAHDDRQAPVAHSRLVALKPDSSLWAWGGDDLGAAGTGAAQRTLQPVRLMLPPVPS